jgi:hypothetical protein
LRLLATGMLTLSVTVASLVDEMAPVTSGDDPIYLDELVT